MPVNWLNYHHLLYFWTVAKTGSITVASRQLRLAHPTISKQIRSLEKTIGHRLFRRTGRTLELTDTGRMVYRYADDIFSLGEELLNTLDGRLPGDVVRLRVGVADVLPKPIVFRFLSGAVRSAGNVRAVCFEGKPSALMAQLAIHELDLVLSDFPMSPEFKLQAYSHLLGESGVTMFASGELRRRYSQGFPASLDRAPFLLPTPNTSLRRMLDQWFDSNGIRPDIQAEFEDSELLKEFGQVGLGVFAATTAIEEHTLEHYSVEVLGRLESLKMRFYAISPERKIKNPAVASIVETVHREVLA